MSRKAILIAISGLVASMSVKAEVIFKWESSQRHSFCQNFPAGREADGRKLFVSQIERRHRFIGVNISFDENGGYSSASPDLFKDGGKTWHIGKAGTHLKDGMVYSYGGKEVDVGYTHIPQGKKYPHFTLCLTPSGIKKQQDQKIKWVTASNGSVPKGAVMGFNRDEDQYVCRAKWAGGIHPGKLIRGQACFFGYGGGEKAVKSYEVLVALK